MALVFNHTVSNRILLATFNNKWRRKKVQDGHVVYIATANKANIELLVSGMKKTIKRQFPKGARIFVVEGTFHFPPHIRL
jgi:repressor of nif and glnA expression